MGCNYLAKKSTNKKKQIKRWEKDKDLIIVIQCKQCSHIHEFYVNILELQCKCKARLMNNSRLLTKGRLLYKRDNK